MNNSELAPIVFFVYNRPDHAKRTIDTLLQNELASQSKLFVFSDGAKNDKDLPAVTATRQYAHSITGFASLTVIEREHNVGCGRNISDGITQIVNQFGKVIVVEDDLLLSPYFLNFMNDGLELYKDDDQVSSINAFIYADISKHAQRLPSTYFLPQTSTWGWATWYRAWRDYDYDAAKLLAQIKERGLESTLNFDNTIDFMGTLTSQAYFNLNTWDIQWLTVNILNRKIGLYPSVAFSRNVGVDGSGTHGGKVSEKSKGYKRINGRLQESYTPITKIPIEINHEVLELVKKVYRDISRKPSLIYRAIRKLYRIIFRH